MKNLTSYLILHLLMITLMVPNPAFGQFWSSTAEQDLPHSNLVENGGFEQSSASWTKSGSSTLTLDSSTPYQGVNSGVWTASAASETLVTKGVSVPSGWAGESCLAEIRYIWLGTSGELLLKVQNDSFSDLATPITLAPTSAGSWATVQVGFGCPSSGEVLLKFESTAASVAISIDKAWIGQDYRIGSGVINVNSHAGSVMAWSSTTAPEGWLIANGSSQLRTDYPDLFDAIGVTYGNADATHFNLPDYRGQFLRGTDSGAAIDPNAGARTDRGDGTTGDNVGTKQADATAANGLDFNAVGNSLSGGVTNKNQWNSNQNAHVHTFHTNVVAAAGGGGGVREVRDSAGGDTANTMNGATATWASANATVTGSVPAQAVNVNTQDSETRPTNVGVIWIIKHTNAGSTKTVTLDNQDWYVSGYITGGSKTYAGAAQATPTDMDLATWSLVPETGSADVNIACSGTEVASGSNCSGNESQGISFAIPAAGTYEVCGSFPHFSGAAVQNTSLGLSETSNSNAATILKEGINQYQISGATSGTYVGGRFCEIFNWASAGAKTVRLMYQAAGASDGQIICADNGNSTRHCTWSVKPINSGNSTVAIEGGTAGIVAVVEYPTTSGCGWARTNTALGAFTSAANCPSPTILYSSSDVTIDTTDDDLPTVKFDAMPAGVYTVTASASCGSDTASNATQQLAIYDGSTTAGKIGYSTNSTTAVINSLFVKGVFVYPVAGARTFSLYGAATANNIKCFAETSKRVEFIFTRYPND